MSVDHAHENAYLTVMSILPIVNIPDPILRVASKPVERFDAQLLSFVDDMLETMYAAPGIGLAAVQVGEPLRVFTVDCSERAETEAEADNADGDESKEKNDPVADEAAEPLRNPIVLINPEIVSFGDAPNIYEEGCLSIPDYYAEVERPAVCVVKYLDRNGDPHELEADGLLSTCIQHEYDHLNGKLFIDYLSKLKRDMVIRKFTKIARQNGTRFIG